MPPSAISKLDENKFDYGSKLNDLWGNLNKKVAEKMMDGCKIMREELQSIQGRHRQFYRIQLHKSKLDKFAPDKKVKKKDKDVQDGKKGK